jgi:protein-S-isoprenylcysteine O-methyltransferase Ste14
MKVPAISHLVLLFFLGGVFLHFLLAGARTFHAQGAGGEPGAAVAQGTFVFGGVIPVWWLGLYQPIQVPNGVFSACILVASIALYEWARHTIWGRRFGIGWGTHVPEELVDEGPYRVVRHPIYLSYLLAFVAAFVALPHWITALMLVGNSGLFAHAARSDERRIAQSPLAEAYAEYRRRVGMFFPHVTAAEPGR